MKSGFLIAKTRFGRAIINLLTDQVNQMEFNMLTHGVKNKANRQKPNLMSQSEYLDAVEN